MEKTKKVDIFWKKNKRIILCSFFSTFLFSMAANGFAYFNLIPRHDALNHAAYFAGNWEVSLGRFLLPVYGMIRGDVLMPWFTGILSILFIMVSAIVIAKLLRIDNPIILILSAGFLSVNYTIIEVCGTFTYVLDSYMLALLFSCVGVYVVNKFNGLLGCIAGGVCFFLSLGLYQSYITIALILFVFLTIGQIIYQNVTLKHLIRLWCHWGISLCFGAIFYFLGYKISLSYLNIAPADSYNSISKLSDITINKLIHQIIRGYDHFKEIFFIESTWNGRWNVVNIILFSVLIIFLVFRIIEQKQNMLKIIIVILCVMIFPLISLLMCILMDYSRIYFSPSYGIFLIYPFSLSFISNSFSYIKNKYKLNSGRLFSLKTLHTTLLFLCVLLLINFIKYANGAYTLQKFTYDRTLSIMTRIIYQMDNIENYIPGETPVVVIGNLNNNDNITNMNTSNEYTILSGYQKASVTYTQTFGSYFKILGEAVNIVTEGEVIDYYNESDYVQRMPIFPQNGYCQIIDDKMIIKLSDVN